MDATATWIRTAGAGWVIALGLGLGLVAACAAPRAADPLPPQPPARGAITALIGDATCDSDDQCRTLPLGSKPCGGPQQWIAWSTQRSDADALRRLAAKDAAAARVENEKRGMRSTCSIVPDPGAQCVAARCVLRERSAAD